MWDSVVGIATGYGLEDPGIESRLGARFSAPVQTDGGTHSVSCTMDVALTTLLASRLKKEYSYKSSPRLGLHGLFYSEYYLASGYV
jgi:hypothetical protein